MSFSKKGSRRTPAQRITDREQRAAQVGATRASQKLLKSMRAEWVGRRSSRAQAMAAETGKSVEECQVIVHQQMLSEAKRDAS